jgi:hypothetical protein
VTRARVETSRRWSQRHSTVTGVAGALALAFTLAGWLGGASAYAAERPLSSRETAAERKTRLANEALDRFLGFWLGEGEFQGTPIVDQFYATRVLDGTFVRVETMEHDGAGFKSEMFIGWDADDLRYELYFFSNFTGFGPQLPVRLMYGYRTGNKLIFEERRSVPLPRRFTFELVDDETFVLTKIIYFPTAQPLSTEEFVLQDPTPDIELRSPPPPSTTSSPPDR